MRRALVGQVGRNAMATLLVDEDFSSGFIDFTTPGEEDPEDAWTRRDDDTPTGSSGPLGGSEPLTKVTTAGNFYAHTEASIQGNSPWSLESRSLDASKGTSTFTFDYHMRFGSVGGIADGTLQVQGWDGAAWTNIGAPIVGSQQTADTDAYLGSDSFDSSAFSNPDFRFRLLFTRGLDVNFANYDCAVDNLRITGPADALNPGGGSGDPNLRASSFNTGLRRIHVSPTLAAPADGSTPDQTVATIQAGLDLLQAGDVMTIEDGDFFERPSRSNIPGTVANPVWIAAETPGGVRILDVNSQALAGTLNWTLENAGTDRYSAAIGDTYAVFDGQDFLPKYSSTATLDATSVDGRNKPERGCTFSGGRLHVRLQDATDPTGRVLVIPATTGRDVMDLGNSNNVIVDGIDFVGGGEQAGISFDTAADNPVVLNCTTMSSRFLCRIGNDAIVSWNFYELRGNSQWMRDVNALNPGTRAAFFEIVKGDLADGGNAVYEGGIGVGAGGFGSGEEHFDALFSFNFICSVFDGMRFGEWQNSIASNNVFEEIGDDSIQMEDDRNNNNGDGNRVFFNRFRNCHGPLISHQNDVAATHEVIRNLCEFTDPAIVGGENFIKTIRTQPGSVIRHAHWYMEHNGNVGNVGSPDDRSTWYPFSSPANSGGDEIDTFVNNIVVFEGDEEPDFDSQSGGFPDTTDGNAWVGSVAEPTFQGASGVFAGTSQADLDLNADFTPQGTSPALGIGVALPAGFEDPIQDPGANDDAGVYPLGFDPGPDWPRPFTETFLVDELPPRWTSPGVP